MSELWGLLLFSLSSTSAAGHSFPGQAQEGRLPLRPSAGAYSLYSNGTTQPGTCEAQFLTALCVKDRLLVPRD